MDPAKLKVVELRAELAARGLEQKGVKAVLVTRLQAALDEEQASGVEPPSVSYGSDQATTETPSTPTISSRRSRRSMSRTKSPSPARRIDSDSAPQLEAVKEEQEDVIIQEDSLEANPDNNRKQDVKLEIDTDADTQKKKVETTESIDEGDNVSGEEHERKIGNADIIGENDDDDDDDDRQQEADTDKKKAKSSDEDEESDKRDNQKRKRSRSSSSSRSAPSTKRARGTTPARNTDDFTCNEDEPDYDEKAVILNWQDSDLFLSIDKSDFCSAKPSSDGALGLAWADVRATYGVTEGKVCYEVQIMDQQRIRNLRERNLYNFRCGWSALNTDLRLGDFNLSFGYDGDGKKIRNGELSSYGKKYGLQRDVIGVYLDLDSNPCTINYTVNGTKIDEIAFEFQKEELAGQALYPHISTKNLAFRVNFGQLDKLLVNDSTEARRRRERERHESSSRRDRRSDRDRSADRDRRRDKRNDDSSSSGEGNKKENSVQVDKNDNDKSDKAKEVGKEEDVNEEEDKEKMQEGDDDVKADVKDKIEEIDNIEEKPEIANEEESESKDETVPETDVDMKEIEVKVEEESPKKESKSSAYDEKELLPEFELIGKLPTEKLVPGIVRPESRENCEVILLIGLSGAGKTFWAQKYAEDNPEKRFNLLGVQNLLEKMKLNGEPRKQHVIGPFNRFVDWCTRSLHYIQDLAHKRRRNFIIDQPNVVATAQRRKMKGFGGFKRIAVILLPNDEVFKERTDKKIEADDNYYSQQQINEMKANFALPTMESDWFNEIIYTDLEGEDAKKKVEEYNVEGKKALPSDNRSRRDRPRDSRFRDRDRDHDRRSNWSDRRGPRESGWRPAPPPHWRNGGGYDRDRDRWHSSSSGGGGGGNNWIHNNRSSGRFDDRSGGGYRGGNSGFRGYDGPPPGRRDYDRDRRDDRSHGGSRNGRDFRDGNRDNRLTDDRYRANINTRGVPTKITDANNKNFEDSNVDQGHWNPNVFPDAAMWQQQQQGNWNGFNAQQQWMQNQQSNNMQQNWWQQ